jgi:hypothetical protein
VRLWGDKTANRAKVKYRAYRANRVFHNSRVFNTARRTHKTLKKSKLSASNREFKVINSFRSRCGWHARAGLRRQQEVRPCEQKTIHCLTP